MQVQNNLEVDMELHIRNDNTVSGTKIELILIHKTPNSKSWSIHIPSYISALIRIFIIVIYL